MLGLLGVRTAFDFVYMNSIADGAMTGVFGSEVAAVLHVAWEPAVSAFSGCFYRSSSRDRVEVLLRCNVCYF